ncbi:hypothetical protein CHLRE_16g654526v5 [Chlamydomonas reinhardtii]|uniref:Uncharacterized protein n=1 Tax=Chlamydomonas reinhardtii TaxID=3055 RepID=A0A2K3CT28_CHLRE|nr:uncharacterized protein CHLRE_16g654526v5 [Chlamydomonas reinhardtii]PNW71443.1 hypothetical protein CHLRE_16g654526v5 [Chlamydomonas reinhardtii]
MPEVAEHATVGRVALSGLGYFEALDIQAHSSMLSAICSPVQSTYSRLVPKPSQPSRLFFSQGLTWRC